MNPTKPKPTPSPILDPDKAERILAKVRSEMDTPWYLILKESRVIRVYHGDLDDSWWKRGNSRGEHLARRVEDEIRNATGLQRVTRKHVRNFVDFHLNAKLFDRAAVAVRMTFKCLADSDESLKRMLSRNLPPPVKPAGARTTRKK